MKSIYECSKCHFTFTKDLESHHRQEFGDGTFEDVVCEGTLKPVLFVLDILAEINRRIEEYEKAMEDQTAPEYKVQLNFIRRISVGQLQSFRAWLSDESEMK